MTIKELNESNEQFQIAAVQISELIPSGGLTNATSLIIRSARRIQSYLEKLMLAKTDVQFGKTVSSMENHMDEIIFMLDQLDISNRSRKISLINDFLKQGYDLLSIYSMWIDQIIKQRMHSEE
ncbi:MAG: hypothetical protein AAGA66_04165 [Bacteroidota bacterium]